MQIECEHRDCSRLDAQPQFTRPLREVKKGQKQPRWFCSSHSKRYKNVSPTRGRGYAS